MGRIAILGWGSLIWDLERLADGVEGGWAMGAGPAFPLEFSRVSAKRKQALAVCIDARHGAACPTHAIASRRAALAEAAADLAARERAAPGRIGFAAADGTAAHGREPAVVRSVAAWCRAGGWAGAVWTDLEPNYAETLRRPFSVVDAAEYLADLGGESRDEAVRYIAQAPRATDTPLRRHLEAADWWRAELRRLALAPF